MSRARAARLPWWRRAVDRLVIMDDTPGRIAGGVAIGVAIGIAPTFGAGLPLAGLLAAWLRCNVAAALAGTVAGAPFVSPFVWAASAWLGARLLGLDWEAVRAALAAGRLRDAGWNALGAYLVGNVVLTAALTAAAWAVTYAVVHRHRRRMAGRRHATKAAIRDRA